MNITIDIPEEITGQLETANIKNVNAFIVELLKNYLEKQNAIIETNKTNDIINKTAEILVGKNINPVEWQRQIRNEEAKKGHLPLTKLFIGILADSNLDEMDYKKHLEEKYR